MRPRATSVSANAFPVSAGPAIASSIRNTNDAAFKNVVPGGGMTDAAPGAERHIVFQIESFTPRVHFEQGYWSATAIANAELAIRVTVYDGRAQEINRSIVAGSGYGELDGGCDAGARALETATNQAIKAAMQNYVSGYGSGRWGGSPTIERTASYALRIQDFVRAGVEEGIAARWCMFWGEDKFQVTFFIDVRDRSNAWIELTHKSRTQPPHEQRYRVELTWTKPHYGGIRLWFQCPRTYRRCAKLYLPLGGYQFWSRQAYRLGYQCQRESRQDRLMRRARKLHRALGGDGCALGQLPPPKPSGMWWTSYARKIDQWRAADDWASGAWTASALRLLARWRKK